MLFFPSHEEGGLVATEPVTFSITIANRTVLVLE